MQWRRDGAYAVPLANTAASLSPSGMLATRAADLADPAAALAHLMAALDEALGTEARRRTDALLALARLRLAEGGAASAHDLARSLHPGNSGLAVWLGTLAHGPSAPPPDQMDLRAWLSDQDAAAAALDEALLQALGPNAQARADLLIRLAQATLLREGAANGPLRPFLPSGSRLQILDPRRSSRHVAVFRKRAGRGAAPPDLRALAGHVRATVS